MMDYLALATEIVKKASANDFEAEAYIAKGIETKIEVRTGKVEKLSYAGSKGLGLRLIKEGRMGYAFTSDFSDASLDQAVSSAIELALVMDADEYRTIPDPKQTPDEDLDIYDPKILDTPIEKKIDFALALEKAALESDPRVVLTLMAMYLDGVTDVYLVNSNGFSGSYKKSFTAGITQALAVEDEDRAMSFGIGVGTSLAELDPVSIGQEAGEQAAKLLGGKPVPTQRATLVYSPFAASGLISAFSRALTADAMQRNRTFLQGKMGQDVASDVVSILDNGRLPGGLATRPFDDEGNPTRATRLVDEGVLQAVLYDDYSAQKDGTNSTGNAARASHRNAPHLSPSNFYIQPGHQSPEELIAGVDQGLYVVNTMNTHSINPVSGDYSVSAQGFWIENGKLGRPVNNVTIALPLQKILKNVKAVANDLLFLPFGGALGSPTFRVDGVMIGGEDA